MSHAQTAAQAELLTSGPSAYGALPGRWGALRAEWTAMPDTLHAEWTKLRAVSGTTVTNPVWLHRLERYTPMNAGLTIQATTGLRSLAITAWAGLGVLAVWAAGALLAGGFLLRLRDA
jgi:hypothetical protein